MCHVGVWRYTNVNEYLDSQANFNTILINFNITLGMAPVAGDQGSTPEQVKSVLFTYRQITTKLSQNAVHVV